MKAILIIILILKTMINMITLITTVICVLSWMALEHLQETITKSIKITKDDIL